MMKSLRATQATELNAIFSFKSLMMEIQNTHRKVKTLKDTRNAERRTLEGDAAKDRIIGPLGVPCALRSHRRSNRAPTHENPGTDSVSRRAYPISAV